jgi:hypothetical protein
MGQAMGMVGRAVCARLVLSKDSAHALGMTMMYESCILGAGRIVRMIVFCMHGFCIGRGLYYYYGRAVEHVLSICNEESSF